MNWKGCGSKWSCPILRYYPKSCLERLRNTTKNLSQYSRYLGLDLNPLLPENEAALLIIWLQLRQSYNYSLCRGLKDIFMEQHTLYSCIPGWAEIDLIKTDNLLYILFGHMPLLIMYLWCICLFPLSYVVISFNLLFPFP